MTKFCLFACLSLLFATSLHGQLLDSFDDGNFTENPAWHASPDDFTVNQQLQLQSASTTPNNTFFITTPNELAQGAEWEFWVKLDFNTSSANYVDVWLTSTSADLPAGTNAGYFVRLGGADDQISLFKKLADNSPVKIIDGVAGVLNASSSTLKIKVIRTTGNRWILLRDVTGTGDSYYSEGAATDASLPGSSYFGVLIRQSTASFFQKHYFDDFVVKPVTDINKPLAIQSIKAVNASTLHVLFEQPLRKQVAEEVTHYHVGGIGNPATATMDPSNGRLVVLTFTKQFVVNQQTNIIIDQVEDAFGNVIKEFMSAFQYNRARRYEVVISEVFADPLPQIQLPTQKFIELLNVADFPVNLSGWYITDGNNSASLPPIELLPDSFLIITTASGLEAYRKFGTTVSVSGFPALHVGGSQLALYDDAGSVIHAMRYDPASYQNEVKKEGGYSLELINSRHGCGGAENWTASNHPSGGTPGKKNSVDTDRASPISIYIKNVYLAANDTLYMALNRSVDSSTATQFANFSFSGGLVIRSIELLPPFLDVVRISFDGPVKEGVLYTITINDIRDCAGNTVGQKNTAQFGVASRPAPGDIVINEILSEPKTTGAEYLELYNRSNHVFDISRLYIANRNSSGEPASITRLSNTPVLFLPQTYLLLTKDPASVLRDYPVADPSAFLRMTGLPSFPNDKGFAIILDHEGNILDEIRYDKSWHFSLIREKKGVSLERIYFDGPSRAHNFHSAAADIGYGTPGTRNSQSKNNAEHAGVFSISPDIFSPDNDGIDDFVTIHYAFPNAGYVTNVMIFDAAGRRVRYLEKNALSGQKGYYRWDGLDDRQGKLGAGIYIIYIESFHESGKKISSKVPVVLVRK